MGKLILKKQRNKVNIETENLEKKCDNIFKVLHINPAILGTCERQDTSKTNIPYQGPKTVSHPS